ncbi:hypothetical protein NFX46_40095 (plasmid) [Streptomyces phaeoluteigriseus]|uniref:HTH cro/C1-type domain-containing protein n=1 Tax=Streptomyces phaeoluteigriseus TaxID=114686 RepID=A0ABY4ZL77_9ACTN|nr:hypothetical protein [Streptomyces phaeoluteigriseus]USQ89888.1 hypothetical protein NFX46_40095 [Streptomyces phaeoluteigriseus]
MSAAKRESVDPRPEALAYGRELKRIFAKQSASQNQVAPRIPVHASQLSRYFSGQTIAGQQQADALIRVVRSLGAVVTEGEVVKLQELRRAAQAASPSQQDRLLALQEQLEDLQQQLDEAEARAGTFRRQAQNLEGVNSLLEDRVGLLQQRVREEERRAGREHWARVKERHHREQAETRAEHAQWWAEQVALRVEATEEARTEVEERAVRAEWGADEAGARLRAVEQARAEAQSRAEWAMQEAEDGAAGLASARKQLSAAAEYAKESSATIEAQQEQLRLLRQEVKVLRHQVRRLTEEARRPASPSVAEPATQVSGGDRPGVSGNAVPVARQSFSPIAPNRVAAEGTTTLPSIGRAEARRARQRSTHRVTEVKQVTQAKQKKRKKKSALKDVLLFVLSFLLVTLLGLIARAVIKDEKVTSIGALVLISFDLLGIIRTVVFFSTASSNRFTRIGGASALGVWSFTLIAVSPYFPVPQFLQFIANAVHYLIS